MTLLYWSLPASCQVKISFVREFTASHISLAGGGVFLIWRNLKSVLRCFVGISVQIIYRQVRQSRQTNVESRGRRNLDLVEKTALLTVRLEELLRVLVRPAWNCVVGAGQSPAPCSVQYNTRVCRNNRNQVYGTRTTTKVVKQGLLYD